MRLKKGKKLIVAGLLSCLLAGCGNVIPELTEEEAAMIATYAADTILENSKERMSRLIDTEKETLRRAELAEKVAQLQKKKADQAEGAVEEPGKDPQKNPQKGSSAGAAGTAAVVESVTDIAGFIGLPGFRVSYGGYEIKKSYSADEGAEWEPTIDAAKGTNLLVIKLNVENISGAPAVADVLSRDMLFSVNGDNGINGMALMTMLLNDFAYAKDEIGAGESKQYVLIVQINENITEAGSLTLQMKKGDARANAALQ